ncbi:hypothetical protein EST38_g9515 [Candolleomyces aberdarensis]|uniref:Nephrocystin 3-like N-terminal domain-containing protein n=1 Tax=Candolleomyces aberdarensis TaxID=2316362 RepID=A0A4Q2D9Q3_9AGAR|nr:hypothetical protein EST38_g9515 [Candolleomyces aberdarensis]
MERLVYEPFQAALQGGRLIKTLLKGPFLIVIDGLDECDDKQGVKELIDHMLDFFKKHPSIPLRIFIASRVEQHIRAHLKTDGVLVRNLDDDSPDEDIDQFLQTSFQIAAKQDPIIQAYIHGHGSWPTTSDMGKLTGHSRGSFALASAIFEFIRQPSSREDPTTPMDRLPLTLEMNGLDGLYTQTLARSEHLPHFRNIISTVALLMEPLPIVGIAGLLGIEAFEAIRVLMNLQAIIHVPGTDEKGEVTLCHTSLRDFFTTESRSGSFFVPPSYHLYLSYFCISSALENNNEQAHVYGRQYFDSHWRLFAGSTGCNFFQEIEKFKARQPLLVDRLPYHAFLCSVFFYTFFMMDRRRWNEGLDLLIECAKQLALAMECPDRHIRLWLGEKLYYSATDHREEAFRLSERAHEALQHDLQCVSTAIHANFPQFLNPPSNFRMINEFTVNLDRLSGIDVFNMLNWIVAHARLEWEDLKITPNPPLELYASYDWMRGSLILDFHGIGRHQ